MAKNLEYYNLELLKIPSRLIKAPGRNSENISNRCVEIARGKEIVGIIQDPGYGIGTGINLFKRTTRFEHFDFTCTQTITTNEILLAILRKCTDNVVELGDTIDDHLVNALAYLFKEELAKSHRPDKIIILRDVENLKLIGLSTLELMTRKMNGIIGILFTISGTDYNNRILGQGDKKKFLKDLATRVKWEGIDPPSPEDLAAYCFKRGVLGEKIILKLISKYPDYKLLGHKIDEIRDSFIKEGYIKIN
jgi:hypothetical protein